MGSQRAEKKAFVLRIAPSGIDRVAEALGSDHLIIGWAEARGLLNPELGWDAFREIIRNVYYADAENLRNAGSAAGNMWRFIREMDEGDLVVVPSGASFYVGMVKGPAFYDLSRVDEDSAYRRPVEWLNGKRSIPRAIAKSALVSRMKVQGTCANATDLQRRLISETLEELRSGRMESFGFERLIETVLKGLGAVETRIVPRREDKGIDIYATFLVAGAFRQIVGIQAKHFQPEPPVSAEVVDQLIRGIEAGQERVTLGMVITSGTFRDDAAARAEAYGEEKGIPIELVDGEQFAKMIIEYGLREKR